MTVQVRNCQKLSREPCAKAPSNTRQKHIEAISQKDQRKNVVGGRNVPAKMGYDFVNDKNRTCDRLGVISCETPSRQISIFGPAFRIEHVSRKYLRWNHPSGCQMMRLAQGNNFIFQYFWTGRFVASLSMNSDITFQILDSTATGPTALQVQLVLAIFKPALAASAKATLRQHNPSADLHLLPFLVKEIWEKLARTTLKAQKWQMSKHETWSWLSLIQPTSTTKTLRRIINKQSFHRAWDLRRKGGLKRLECTFECNMVRIWTGWLDMRTPPAWKSAEIVDRHPLPSRWSPWQWLRHLKDHGLCNYSTCPPTNHGSRKTNSLLEKGSSLTWFLEE